MELKLPVDRTGLLSPDWLAETVRLTAFLPPSSAAPRPIWGLLTGRDPVQTSERKNDGLLNEVGDFGAGSLIIHQQGGRMDIVLGPPQQALPVQIVQPGEISLGSEILHVGPAIVAISAFFEAISRAPGILDGAHRIGFSPSFIKKAEDITTANARILEYVDLPIQEDDLDVLWQVNRPVAAKSFKGRINRLMRWQSGVSVFQQFPMIFGQAQPVSGHVISRKFFTKCELDANSYQFSELPISLQNPQESLKEIVSLTEPILLQTRCRL